MIAWAVLVENPIGLVISIWQQAEARHVRISCTERGTQWGHAIRELEVFE
jgi:hypothetical protein